MDLLRSGPSLYLLQYAHSGYRLSDAEIRSLEDGGWARTLPVDILDVVVRYKDRGPAAALHPPIRAGGGDGPGAVMRDEVVRMRCLPVAWLAAVEDQHTASRPSKRHAQAGPLVCVADAGA